VRVFLALRRNFLRFRRIAINTKHTAKNTFTLVGDLTGPYAFGKNNRDNLNGKLDLYFQDFSMIGLFVQASPLVVL
jgi:replication factor C subunit 1